MEERQVTIEGEPRPLPDPFLVIATQNPIEYEGTFALPEAQLDRFMLRIRLGYPSPVDEVVILDEQKRRHPIDELEVVCSTEELQEMQRAVREIYVDPTVAWRSSMHSSNADWVLGVARLISSASTTWLMIGPARNSNSWVFWL